MFARVMPDHYRRELEASRKSAHEAEDRASKANQERLAVQTRLEELQEQIHRCDTHAHRRKQTHAHTHRHTHTHRQV